MLTNYLKVAWRHIRQNKMLSFINIFGLATGMAFALLIYMWVLHEKSFDNFHVNKDKIGLVMQHTEFNHERNSQPVTQLALYYELKSNYPEVAYNSRVSWSYPESIMAGDKKIIKNGMYADPDFLKMFSFPLEKGDTRTALQDPNSILVTASMAKALFGNEDPIGKTVKLNGKYDMLIAGILKDIPENSTYNFDFLGAYEFQIQIDPFKARNRSNWGNNFLMNVVQVKDNSSLDALAKKIAYLPSQRDATIKNRLLTIQSLPTLHLYDNYKNWQLEGGRISYVRLFTIIGLFVLLVACMNFMNLTTARSAKRAREVGVRKAAGSSRRQLMVQFLSESMLTAVIAFFFALILMVLLFPLLSNVGFDHIHMNSVNIKLILIMLGVCLGTGFIAGIYPAVYLSSFKPLDVLKGTMKLTAASGWFRRTLVISQFAISAALIICTVIVYQQIKHGQTREVGYDPNNLINVTATEELNKNYTALRQDLMNTGKFEAVAHASQPMTAIYNIWSDFDWAGKDPNVDIAIGAIMSDFDFDKTVGLKFRQGRGFSAQFATDSNSIIINEAARKVMGFKDPLDKIVRWNGKELHVIGVVDNVLLTDPFSQVEPLIVLYTKDAYNSVFLRPKANADMKAVLAAATPIFEKYNPTVPFSYSFTSTEFAKKFEMEQQVAKIASLFAALAILISCLGLFGLAMFMAERRTREIGIRKVLGATTTQLWILMSKEFIWLVLLACIIASPFAWYLMKNWLQHYDYRITINAWVFLATALVAMFIALATVSTQSVRAALINPAKSLKAE
ncbi:ABC transporter permease [Chitinophaga sp. Cy-1792]|uniref:ABC transporter permease n=1 Tax=Chitinophaga sp. Cy-1792 TaxID=2608339 RepID=UPI00141E537D|nr:ABC transporter permease [Chitinophaga sp. Cy-1792]NIG53927.1 FtsX-like permease family protein [Chitinophaga sp. Cy-1792]